PRCGCSSTPATPRRRTSGSSRLRSVSHAIAAFHATRSATSAGVAARISRDTARLPHQRGRHRSVRALHMRADRVAAQAGGHAWQRAPPGDRRGRRFAWPGRHQPQGTSRLNIGSLLDRLKWRRLQALRRRRVASRTRPEQEPALRAELFSAEQMERHGRVLAAQHRLRERSHADLLLGRLADNEAVITHICERLTDATRRKRRITPAGEWLLDNFYLIEEQIRTARRHLPRGYSRELPRLDNGASAGLPRVYDIALEIIAHGDGRIDTAGLHRFIHAYQEVTPL